MADDEPSKSVMENMRRAFAKPSASEPFAKTERPGTKTLDYIALGLLLAPPAVVFEMFIKGKSINWQRTAIATVASWVSGGFVVLASHGWQSWRSADWRFGPYLVAAENKILRVKALIIAASMGFAFRAILDPDK